MIKVNCQINFEFLLENHKHKRGLLLEGGSRCFYAGQKVVTLSGSKEISKIDTNDLVLSYNEKEDRTQYKRVVKVHKFDKTDKKIIQINLKNGQIIKGTEDHKIYYKGGWITLKHFVSLLDGSME